MKGSEHQLNDNFSSLGRKQEKTTHKRPKIYSVQNLRLQFLVRNWMKHEVVEMAQIINIESADTIPSCSLLFLKPLYLFEASLTEKAQAILLQCHPL
jgi:biotin synthase-like enzyme